MPYIIFVLKIPTFGGFYAWLLIGVKGQKKDLVAFEKVGSTG